MPYPRGRRPGVSEEKRVGPPRAGERAAASRGPKPRTGAGRLGQVTRASARRRWPAERARGRIGRGTSARRPAGPPCPGTGGLGSRNEATRPGPRETRTGGRGRWRRPGSRSRRVDGPPRRARPGPGGAGPVCWRRRRPGAGREMAIGSRWRWAGGAAERRGPPSWLSGESTRPRAENPSRDGCVLWPRAAGQQRKQGSGRGSPGSAGSAARASQKLTCAPREARETSRVVAKSRHSSRQAGVRSSPVQQAGMRKPAGVQPGQRPRTWW